MIKNASVIHDTEDKKFWLRHGEELERRFVAFCNSLLEVEVCINPEKATQPTAPDLLFHRRLADLKTQNTPFFMAGKYGCDPRFTWTMNLKDYRRYNELYPDVDLLVWLDWQQLSMKIGETHHEVKYLFAVYHINFREIAKMIETGSVPLHGYQRREASTGRGPLADVLDGGQNAKASFVFDLSTRVPLFLSRVPMRQLGGVAV